MMPGLHSICGALGHEGPPRTRPREGMIPPLMSAHP